MARRDRGRGFRRAGRAWSRGEQPRAPALPPLSPARLEWRRHADAGGANRGGAALGAPPSCSFFEAGGGRRIPSPRCPCGFASVQEHRNGEGKKWAAAAAPPGLGAGGLPRCRRQPAPRRRRAGPCSPARRGRHRALPQLPRTTRGQPRRAPSPLGTGGGEG